jgi:hypothetical protein
MVRLMRFLKLRIAWSVVWGLAAVLLIVLWVRSYWVRDRISHNYFGQKVAWMGYSVDSLRGLCSILITEYENGHGPDRMHHVSWPADATVSIMFPAVSQARKFLGFKWESSADTFDIIVPYWFPVLALVAIASAPWLPRRFTTRTLLIATSLVAVLLGIVVWLSR